MKNNEKLKIIKKILRDEHKTKLKAEQIAEICCKKLNSVWGWTSKPDTARYRSMDDSSYKHIVNFMCENGYAKNPDDLENQINQHISESESL